MLPPCANPRRPPDNDVLFDDGVAYKLGWKPMFEFTARAGEAVLFPPGWIHETLNSGEGCTVALTTQFELPMPARYYRSYYPRLRRIGDLNSCWKKMFSWGSAGEKVSLKGLKKLGPQELRRSAEQLYERRSGTLTEKELDFFDVDGKQWTINASYPPTHPRVPARPSQRPGGFATAPALQKRDPGQPRFLLAQATGESRGRSSWTPMPHGPQRRLRCQERSRRRGKLPHVFSAERSLEVKASLRPLFKALSLISRFFRCLGGVRIVPV